MISASTAREAASVALLAAAMPCASAAVSGSPKVSAEAPVAVAWRRARSPTLAGSSVHQTLRGIPAGQARHLPKRPSGGPQWKGAGPPRIRPQCRAWPYMQGPPCYMQVWGVLHAGLRRQMRAKTTVA